MITDTVITSINHLIDDLPVLFNKFTPSIILLYPEIGGSSQEDEAGPKHDWRRHQQQQSPDRC